MIKTDLKSKFNTLEQLAHNILRHLLSAIIGFIISKTGISSTISPFAVSFISILPKTELSLLSSFFGVIFGYITNDFSALNFKYICANSVMIAIILISGRNNYLKNIYSPVLSGAVLFAVGFLFLFAEKIEIYGILLIICESILCCCSAYFLHYFIMSVKRKTKMDTKDIVAFNVTVLIFLCAVDNLYVYGFSVSSVLLQVIIFLCAYYFDTLLSLCFSLSLCTVIALLHIENLNFFAIFYIPALVSTIASKINKKHIVSAFTVTYLAVLTMTGFTYLSIYTITTPMISAIIFYLIPKQRLQTFIGTFITVRTDEISNSSDNELCIKYCRCADSLIRKINNPKLQPVLTEKNEKNLKRYLIKNNCSSIEITTLYNDKGNQIVTVTCETSGNLTCREIEKKLMSLTDSAFHLTEEYQKENLISLRFEQRDKYRIESYALYKPKSQEKVCGDNACAFKGQDSKYYIILADGMGSGKEAFTKSYDAISILKKLLKNNIDTVTALKTVNSSMEMLSDEIGFSTIDLCKISLRDAMAEFYKCGGYVSMVLRDKAIIRIKENGLPAGLGESIKIDKQLIKLESGDIIVMLSDGVVNAIDKIDAVLLSNSGLTPEVIAREIMMCATQNTPKGLDDDMSVIVSKIIKN